MKKLILLLLIATITSSCYTYIPGFGVRRVNTRLQPYHRMGVNGYHLPNRRYNRIIIPRTTKRRQSIIIIPSNKK
jgi:hypothetical protein